MRVAVSPQGSLADHCHVLSARLITPPSGGRSMPVTNIGSEGARLRQRLLRRYAAI